MTNKQAEFVLDHPHSPVPLRWVDKGDSFTLHDFHDLEEVGASRVYVRGEYDCSSRRFICHKWADVNDWHEWSGDKLVYVNFTF